MEVRGAIQSEVAEIVDLAATVFVTECRPRYASQHYEDSSYETHQSRVCIVDGKIVSHVRVAERAMHIGSAVVKLGGIGMVGALEEHHHRGYASALMRDAVDYMEDRGYDLGLLLTGIQPFYMQFGWAPFPQTSFEMELGGKKSFEPSTWTVRPFDGERDLPQVIDVYNEHNRRRTGTIARTDQHWRDGYARQVGLLPTLIAERGGAIDAYANVVLAKDGSDANVEDAWLSTYYPNVREVGWRAGSPDSLLPLCHAILERAYEEGLPSITGRLPRHHPMTMMLSRESGSPLSFSIAEASMYLVISLHSLFQKLVPEFEARLKDGARTSASGSFTFTVQDQVCTLAVKRGKVDVTADDRGRTKVPLDAYRFIKVLLGDASFGELDEFNRFSRLMLSTRERATLSALFPKGEPVHWVCDYL